MSNVRRGYSRDRAIVELVERCGALSTQQVAVMLFGGLQYGHRKAQERLQKLAKRRLLSRIRLGTNQPYIYYTGRQLSQLEHRVALNWALIWLQCTSPSWESVVSWEYEPDYGHVRPDMLWVTENKVTKSYRTVYVELDRSERNKWDKARKYNQLYERETYSGAWWVERTDRFPRVLVATTTEARAKQITSAIVNDNEHDLRFDVRLSGDLEREVWPWV